MQNHFSLHRVADGDIGERFVIVMENGGTAAYESKPMPASHAQLALHKLGTSDAAIASMIEDARRQAGDDRHN